MGEAENEVRGIAKVDRGPDGGKPAYKTYLDAKAIEPGITINLVKGWFKLTSRQRTRCGDKGTATLPQALTMSIRRTCVFCN